jgi:two-component system LytT family response regulator
VIEVIIVDDEPAGRRSLSEFCAAEPDLRVIGEYGDPTVALAEIRRRRPQLLFLDIQMEPISGLQLARGLDGAHEPFIVFVTAHDQHALEAFELSAADYLLKPFDRSRFQKTLARIRPRLGPAAVQAGPSRPRLLAEIGGQLHMVEVAHIEMIEADRNYVLFRVGRDAFHARGTLAQAEAAAASLPLLRISRSCLVNVDYIRHVNRTLRGDFIFVMAGGATVTSSEGFRARVREYLAGLKLA